MQIVVGHKYIIELTTPRGVGGGQIVRVYRKWMFFRKRMTSDWFLDREQAERFARKVAVDLAGQRDGSSIRSSHSR
jgi:hypothetical protein